MRRVSVMVAGRMVAGRMVAGGVLVASLGLAGCGGGTTVSVPNGNGGTTKVAVPSLGGSKFCSSLQSAAQKLESGSLAQLSDPSGSSSASSELAPEISAFKDLASSAPSAIKGTLDDLVSTFTEIEQATSALSKDASDPSALSAAEQKLTTDTSSLSGDDVKLGGYISSHCT
jgi:hypothetical protein